MIKLGGISLDGRAFPEFTWNADLIEFEGPLLSLFKKDDGRDALFSWIDADTRHNRWAIFEVTRVQLSDYLAQKKTLLDIVENSDEILTFDTGPRGRRVNMHRLSQAQFPAAYRPERDSFLTPEISTPAAIRLRDETTIRYDLKLDGDELYTEDLSAISKIYQQLYSFHYGLEHLNRPAVRERIVKTMTKWTGGFTAVHLFSGLRNVMPSIHRARIAQLQYASPGFIKLELLPRMADQISHVVERMFSDASHIKAELLYKECYSYFKANKLSGFEDGDTRIGDNLNEIQKEQIGKFVTSFFEILDLKSYGKSFSHLEINELSQLRAVLSYYRRLRQLLSFIDRGILKIPRYEEI